MISPKTIDSTLIPLMFSSVRKTSSVFKIQSWKREAEKLKQVNVFKYKTILATIAAYENKNEEALEIFNSTFNVTQDVGRHAMTYANMGNILGHTGDYLKSIDYRWKAFELTKEPMYFNDFLNLCSLYYIIDQRMYDMSALDDTQKNNVRQCVSVIEDEVKFITDNINLNIDLYREILKRSYTIFFKYCTTGIQRLVEVNPTRISTILFHKDFDLETVELLNDQLNEQLVDLLETYEYEEILKYPILFTAQEF